MPTFLSADLVTGVVRDQLPLEIAGDVSRLLMNVGSGTFTLSVRDPSCPADWEDLTAPWRTLLVAIDDDEQILWAGIPTNRTRDPLSAVVTVPCITVEGYLDRRYVPTMTFRQKDQTSSIARALVETTNAHGLGILFDTPASGVYRDREYFWDETVSVLQRVNELAQSIDGFEWTIDVDWADANHTRVVKTFRTGAPHLGRITSSPSAVFELPGGITEGSFDELWGDGDASTHVRAVGDGQGDSRAISAPVVDLAAEAGGTPRLELVRSFSGVTTTAVLNSHASAVAAETFGGQKIITISTRADQPPEFTEYDIGDTARIQIETEAVSLDEVWRIIGWYLTPGSETVKPALARVRTPLDGDWIWT